jgi:glucose-6-phosphate 1-dehydrogenase
MAEHINPHTVHVKRLQVCNIPEESFRIEPFTLVIFGGTGDLSQKKLLPALYHTFIDHAFPEEASIVGIGTRDLSHGDYRDFAMQSIRKYCIMPTEGQSLSRFAGHLYYFRMDAGRGEDYPLLCRFIQELPAQEKETGKKILYYLAVHPLYAEPVITNLKSSGLCSRELRGKVVMEKPFGHNRASAGELNRILLQGLQEKEIYRIDHYLAKDTVQNIMFFRFSNSIFEPLWNRSYIDHVQITVAEDIGIASRGRFYEGLGIVRDIIQNHMLQLIALVAMEPPVSFEADFIRSERAKLFRSIRPIDEEYIQTSMVRGQYGPGIIRGEAVPGYRQELHVAPDSSTPTFFAGIFHIDNWRWAGVPFYVRAGKRLATSLSEINIFFKQPPLKLFSTTCDALDPNILTLTIQPQEQITLQFGVKYPGQAPHIYPVVMEFSYEKTFDIRRYPPYERILIDIMRDDLTLFARHDEVEAAWSIVDPIITLWEAAQALDYPNYAAGSWGPVNGTTLIERDGRSWYRW